MNDEADIERTAAFDEQLREHTSTNSDSIEPTRIQTLRLLHEVFRAAASPEVRGEFEPALPDRVGRFRIQRLLGRGGFGTVYLADDPLLNRHVALKVIHSHLLQDPAMRNRALREREAMARLQHSNIIPVWEANEDQDQLFIVSEYCPGQTLAEWLLDHPGPMPVATAVQWVSRLADAVAHSHQRGVIHRDLKPSNILLDPISASPSQTIDSAETKPLGPNSLEPRLSDFGLAKILDSSTGGVASMVTQAGLFVGSLEYASPEQVKGLTDAIYPTTDVYALGVLLFQLLTGRLPHVAESQYDLARLICEVPARFPRESLDAVPKDLQAITLRAMAIEISDRYPSADALRDDLERFRRGQPVEARPVSSLELLARVARKRPAVTSLAFVCCLLTLMYLYNLVASNRALWENSQALKSALAHAREQTRLAEEGQLSLNKLRYRETMKLAFEQWQEQNYIGLHDSLQRLGDQQPATMELAFLQQQLKNVYHKFDLQNEPVDGLVWDPKNQHVISIGANGKLRRWRPDCAEAVSEAMMAVGAHCLALHPDGETLAMPESVMADAEPLPLISESSASRISFWNARTDSKCREPIQFHTRTVESLEYSPDGRWLAAGPRYVNVVVSDMEDSEPFAIKSERRNRQILFSPQSDRVAVYSSFGTIEIHDLQSRKLLLKCVHKSGDDLGSVYSMAWVPGQELLIANASPQSLNVYSTKDGRRVLQVHAGIEGETMAVSPEGHYVAIGDNLGFVKVFDLRALLSGSAESAGVTSNMRVLSGKILDMAFIDAGRLVACDAEGNMIQLSLPVDQPSLKLDALVRRIHWHDNQHLWAFENHGESLHFVHAGKDRLELLTTLPAHFEREVARAQSATHIAVADMDGKITILDSKSNQLVSACQLPTGNAQQAHSPVSDRLQFSADGQLLYATGENNKLCAIRVKDGKLVWTKLLTNSGHCVVEDAKRRRIFLGGAFETLRVFDSQNGDSRGDQVAGNGTSDLIVDTRRDRLISSHHDGTVRDRRLASDASPIIGRVANNRITALTITPDHRTLIAGDNSGVLRMTDEEIALYGVLYSSSLRAAEVAQLKWSPDRRRLAAVVYSKEDPQSEIVIFESGSAADVR